MRRRLEDFLLQIWSGRGLLSNLLLPFSWLYGRIAQQRMQAQARNAWRAPVPVLVIGNIMTGGTGKTPVTIAVCQALQAAGRHPGIISRGYGTTIGPEPHLSDTSADSNHLGDEPALLHAATGAPVAVHPRRSLAAAALLKQNPDIDVLLSDDGLQHTALARDMEIIVQDARGTGNGRLLPAGPLREPANRLQQAHWLISNLNSLDDDCQADMHAPDPSRCVRMQLQIKHMEHLASGRQQDWDSWLAQNRAARCSALAGIAQPDRFFTMLRNSGLRLEKTLRIADHHPVSLRELQSLGQGPVLMTQKDAIKYDLPADDRIWVVHANPGFSDPLWLGRLNAELDEISRAMTAQAVQDS